MRLSGIHHVTAITGDAAANVDFYTGVLGLRMVGKTVNQDDPTVYHLFYASEEGKPGSEMTFFEYPGAIPGRAGDGMVHTVEWRVGSPDAIDFWAARIEGSERVGERLRFTDPEGLAHQLVVHVGDEPLTARHPEIPEEHALQGFHGVRAYSSRPEGAAELLTGVMGAEQIGDHTYELRSERRGATIAYEPPPAEPGRQSAGTVHHVAWGTTVEEHPGWNEHLTRNGIATSGIIDRHYFHSIYFRERGGSGVLFEIADDAPGFTVDVPLERLGEVIILPPRFEAQREAIEARLTPLPDPRAGWAG